MLLSPPFCCSGVCMAKKKKKSMRNTFRLFLSKAHLKERDLCPPCSLNSALSHLGGIQPSAPCKAENFAAPKKKNPKTSFHPNSNAFVLFSGCLTCFVKPLENKEDQLQCLSPQHLGTQSPKPGFQTGSRSIWPWPQAAREMLQRLGAEASRGARLQSLGSFCSPRLSLLHVCLQGEKPPLPAPQHVVEVTGYL